ncbi:hypothetical protein D3C85_1355370 [compost metagenome]
MNAVQVSPDPIQVLRFEQDENIIAKDCKRLLLRQRLPIPLLQLDCTVRHIVGERAVLHAAHQHVANRHEKEHGDKCKQWQHQ